MVGQSTLSPDNLHGELLNLNYANPGLAVRTIEQHRDLILGIKVRLTRNIAGENDLRALHLAREAAEAVKLPIMVHIGDTYTPLKELLPVLRRATSSPTPFTDAMAAFSTRADASCPRCCAAVGRGVHLDVGHGAGSFSFAVAERPSSRTCFRVRSRAIFISSTSTVPYSTWPRLSRNSSIWD